jgi:hypothetical protein
LGIKLGLRPLLPSWGLYIQEEMQPHAILGTIGRGNNRKGDNKTRDNSGLIIAGNNKEKGEEQ